MTSASTWCSSLVEEHISSRTDEGWAKRLGVIFRSLFDFRTGGGGGKGVTMEEAICGGNSFPLPVFFLMRSMGKTPRVYSYCNYTWWVQYAYLVGLLCQQLSRGNSLVLSSVQHVMTRIYQNPTTALASWQLS